MEGNTERENDALAQFCSMCGTSPEQAAMYLGAHGWDMDAACTAYFQDQEDQATQGQAEESTAPSTDDYTGPRTLDGRPAPQSSSAATRRQPVQPKRKGVATLGSLGSSSHNHDDDDDDDEDDHSDGKDRGDLFAGGEKSGLAVRDPTKEGGPKKIINDILAKAKANATRQEPGADAGPSRQSFFRGTGMTLGGEGIESRSIPDPRGTARAANTQPQERVLHLWTDGFSVDDGELRRFDDPANQMDLQMIRSGRAPLHLMNVENDQPVDVRLTQHDTPYTPQPRQYRPFAGAGQRLGAPVPGDGNTAASAPAATTQASTGAATTGSSPAAPEVDSSQPALTLRIQMPDGTRLPARFNHSHTIGNVYDFVRGASPATSTRELILATNFPYKEHTDTTAVLGEMPEFKKGGTAIVKFA
ncbi:UBX domain-containing protein [Paramyrothecium foliicola]|nr:UBX domain-containing protein [Paramyrothecium foliicola]